MSADVRSRCMTDACGGQKRALASQKLKLGMVVSCRVSRDTIENMKTQNGKKSTNFRLDLGLITKIYKEHLESDKHK